MAAQSNLTLMPRTKKYFLRRERREGEKSNKKRKQSEKKGREGKQAEPNLLEGALEGLKPDVVLQQLGSHFP
jgi:hypothetical protein